MSANCFQKAKTHHNHVNANSPENSNQNCELIDSNAPCQPSPGGSSDLYAKYEKRCEYILKIFCVNSVVISRNRRRIRPERHFCGWELIERCEASGGSFFILKSATDEAPRTQHAQREPGRGGLGRRGALWSSSGVFSLALF